MGKVHIPQNSFNGGVWSPLMEGRWDLAKYQNALYRGENVLLYPHGPAQKRPGKRFIAETKDSTKASRTLPFEFSDIQAYILEFGDLYMRVYKDQGQVTDGGSAYEIVSPYAESDLFQLKICQSADVLYIFHPDYAPRKLERTGHTSWTLSTIEFMPPATAEQEIEPEATLTPEAVAGQGIYFTTDVDYWQNGDVGREIISGNGRAVIRNISSTMMVKADIIKSFASNATIALGDWSLKGSPTGTIAPSAINPKGAKVQVTGDTESGRKNLVSTSAVDDWWGASAVTGEFYLKNSSPMFQAAKPAYVYISDAKRIEATVGSLATKQWDWGDNDALGYSTIYVNMGGNDPDTKAPKHPEYVQCAGSLDVFRESDIGKYIIIQEGVIEITEWISSNRVDGIILHVLEDGTATSNFTIEERAWTDENGYPGSGTFFEDRLMLAGSPEFPLSVWGSQVGDYEDIAPGTDDADAVKFNIAGRKVNRILWVEPTDTLICGESNGEWVLGPGNKEAAWTPLNVQGKQKTNRGCADIQPLRIDSSVLFVQEAARKLLEFTWNWESEGYKAPDLTRLAEHITLSGIKDIAYQREPLSIIWVVTNDGRLLSLTYLREEEVIAWCEHPTDGTVESVACIPGDGYDEVWLIVNRTIDVQTKRYIEMMEEICNDNDATYKANKGLNAFFVDSGLTYNGAPATVITGIDHLVGETVAILADGSVRPQQVVSAGGSITLTKAASIVHVGLPYSSIIQPMRPEIPMRDGTRQGMVKKIVDIIARVYQTGVFKFGTSESTLDKARFRNSDMDMDEAPTLKTGDVFLDYDGPFEYNARPLIVSSDPVPFTLIALITSVEVE